MTWLSEAKFVEACIESDAFIPRVVRSKSSCIRVFRELRTGYGRPDIVVVEFDKQIVAERRKESTLRGRMPLVNAFAMTYLADRRWVSHHQLGSYLSVSGGALKKLIRDLVDRGLVESNGHLIKARPRAKTLAIRRMWVFEAKLYNWRQAIDQAQRHLWFTSDSYVLMPDRRQSLLQTVKGECVKRGIGLIIFGVDGSYRLVVRSAKRGFINSPVLWSINEQLLIEEGDDGDFVQS